MNIRKAALLIATVSILMVQVGIAQTTRSRMQNESLNGRVMQVTQANLQLNKPETGPAVLDTMMKLLTKFDKKGNAVETVAYITNIMSIYADRKRGQKFITKYDNHYDEKGHLKQVDVYEDTTKQNTITYDDKGNMQESKLLFIGLKTYYKYTPDKYIGATVNINTKGDTTLTIKYTYNQRGDLIKTQSFLRHETFDTPTYYLYKTYDANGNWTKRTVQTDYKYGASSPESIQERTYIYYR
ncbi:MAG: hypothetical protein V4592_22090 [Bacteroidota bacterium]